MVLFQVIFTDESMFEVTLTNPRYIRIGNETPNNLHLAQTVKHPVKVMVWGCFSFYGTGRLHICESTINAEAYEKVLIQRRLVQAREWYGEDAWILMHDSAPCHKAKRITKFLSDNNVNVLSWPGNSPDMNPIETLWAIVKNKLRKTSFTTKSELINRLLSIWNRNTPEQNDLQETCKKLIQGMPKRVSDLLKSKGKQTKK